MSSKRRATAQISAASARSSQRRKSDGGRCRTRQLPAQTTAFSTTLRKPRNGRRRKVPPVNETGSRCSRGPRQQFGFATLGTVVELLAETINQVRRGEIDPKVANAVGFLVRSC